MIAVLLVVVRFDAAADFDAVDAGNHDVQDQKIRFGTADFNQGGDSVRSGIDFIATLTPEKRLEDIDDFLFVVDDEDIELPTNQRFRSGHLVLSKKCQKVVTLDTAMTTGRPIRRIGFDSSVPRDSAARRHMFSLPQNSRS